MDRRPSTRSLTEVSGITSLQHLRAQPDLDSKATLTPYCLVGDSEIVLIETSSLDSLQNADFLYLEQRKIGLSYLQVPIDFLDINARKPQAHWLFSPGRAGTTLLTKYLRLSGKAVISECDVHTNLASSEISEHSCQRIARASNAHLFPGEQKVFVKLRAQCALKPQKLVSDNDAVSYIWRNAEEWFRSQARLFGAGPVQLSNFLLAAINARAQFETLGVKISDISTSDIIERPGFVLGLLGLEGAEIEHIPNDFDVQQNSPVSRENLNFEVDVSETRKFNRLLEDGLQGLTEIGAVNAKIRDALLG